MEHYHLGTQKNPWQSVCCYERRGGYWVIVKLYLYISWSSPSLPALTGWAHVLSDLMRLLKVEWWTRAEQQRGCIQFHCLTPTKELLTNECFPSFQWRMPLLGNSQLYRSDCEVSSASESKKPLNHNHKISTFVCASHEYFLLWSTTNPFYPKFRFLSSLSSSNIDAIFLEVLIDSCHCCMQLYV